MPVFFVWSITEKIVDIHSGSQPDGLVRRLNVFEDVPLAYRPTTSKNFLQLAQRQSEDFILDVVYYNASESIEEATNFLPLSHQVIDGVAYFIALRSHIVTHSYEYQFQYFTYQGANGSVYGPVGDVQEVSRSEVLDAVHDVAVYAVNLESGDLSVDASVFYEFQATPVINTVGSLNFLAFDTTQALTPLPVAISQALPVGHPFKDCGFAIWSLSDVNPLTTVVNAQYDELPYDLPPSLSSWATPPQRRNIRLGLSTTSGRRVIQRDNVLEFSSYQRNSDNDCEFYDMSSAVWADSYADYSPAVVLDRDEVFTDLSGFSPSDQELFLTAGHEPPASISPGTYSAATTLDAQYFIDADLNGLRFQMDLIDGRPFFLSYWIID